MSAHAWINDVDLEIFGVRIHEVVNSRSLAGRDWPIRPLPGRGQVLTSDRATPQARRMVLKGSQEAETLEALHLRRRELIWYLNRANTEVKLADRTGSHLRCLVVGADIPPVGPWANNSRPAHRIEIELLAPDPVWYANNETVVDFTAGPTPMPINTAVSRPVIQISGPCVNPKITLRAADGTIRCTMEVIETMEHSQYITIDTDLMTVKAGDGTTRLHALKEGLWITLDPNDAGGPNGPWPTLEVAPIPRIATATYRKGNE